MAKPRHQWRLRSFVPSISLGAGGVDSSVEGASGLENDGDGVSLCEGSSVLLDQPGLGWEGRAVRQGASVTRSRGLRKVRQGPTRVMSGPDGRRRQPLCRGAIDHGHGWCGGINHRATRGRRRRLRLSGAIEQGVAAKARARVRAVGSRA